MVNKNSDTDGLISTRLICGYVWNPSIDSVSSSSRAEQRLSWAFFVMRMRIWHPDTGLEFLLKISPISLFNPLLLSHVDLFQSHSAVNYCYSQCYDFYQSPSQSVRQELEGLEPFRTVEVKQRDFRRSDR